MPQHGVRLSVVGRRPRANTVDSLRHRRVHLGWDAVATPEPEDESVGGRTLGFQSRLAVVRVTDADAPRRVEQPEVESAVEWARLVGGEETRPVDEQPVIPAHRLVVTQRSVQRRLQ